MQYKLTALETLGVATIGAVIGLAVDKLLHDETTPIEHHRAVMASVAGVYVLGVVIGTMRPEGGYISMSEDGE